jgi:hypothetical protein
MTERGARKEPQRRETAHNIVGLLCQFVTRLFHDHIYSQKMRRLCRGKKIGPLKSIVGDASALRQNDFFKEATHSTGTESRTARCFHQPEVMGSITGQTHWSLHPQSADV